MKTVSTIALVLALALAGSASPALAKEKPAKEGQIKISEKVQPIAVELQKALAAKDWATAQAKADQAAPLIATPDDKMFIGNGYVQIGQATNDQATLGKGVDLMLESGKADPTLAPKLYAVQGSMAFQAKNYPKAEAALGQAYKLKATDANLVPMLVESKRLQSKNADALQTLNEAIAANIAAGQQVPAEWFQRGFAIAYGVKAGSPEYPAVHQAGNDLNKKWLASYPTPAVWHDALLLYSQGKSGDADLQLDVHRLLLAANGLIGAPDYLEYAESVYLKNPGEAKMVIDAGAKKGVYTIASNKNISEINGIASGRVAADKASLAGSEKTAQNNGKVALAVGDAYYGYGNHAKAVEMYKLAATKGIDADLVNVRIGSALATAGDTAGAKAAFGQVKGQLRKDLADFWVVHLDHPTAG